MGTASAPPLSLWNLVQGFDWQSSSSRPSNAPSDHEKAIPSLALSQNPQSFNHLVEQYGPMVYRLCFRILHHRENAEDMTQEVFVKAWKALDRFRGDSGFSTWLHRIAVTQCLDLLRHQKRKKRKDATTPASPRTIPEWQQPVDPHDGPERVLEQKELLALLHEALLSLPRRQQMALALAQAEDTSSEGIAQSMGLTVTAVDSLLYRARQNLKNTILAATGTPDKKKRQKKGKPASQILDLSPQGRS